MEGLEILFSARQLNVSAVVGHGKADGLRGTQAGLLRLLRWLVRGSVAKRLSFAKAGIRS